MVFARVYDSRISENADFGPGWRPSLAGEILVDGDAATYVDASDARHAFAWDGTAWAQSPPMPRHAATTLSFADAGGIRAAVLADGDAVRTFRQADCHGRQSCHGTNDYRDRTCSSGMKCDSADGRCRCPSGEHRHGGGNCHVRGPCHHDVCGTGESCPGGEHDDCAAPRCPDGQHGSPPDNCHDDHDCGRNASVNSTHAACEYNPGFEEPDGDGHCTAIRTPDCPSGQHDDTHPGTCHDDHGCTSPLVLTGRDMCGCPSSLPDLCGDVCRASCPTGQVRRSSDCTCVGAGGTPGGAGHCTRLGASRRGDQRGCVAAGRVMANAQCPRSSCPTNSDNDDGLCVCDPGYVFTVPVGALYGPAECVGRTAALCGLASDPGTYPPPRRHVEQRQPRTATATTATSGPTTAGRASARTTAPRRRATARASCSPTRSRCSTACGSASSTPRRATSPSAAATS